GWDRRRLDRRRALVAELDHRGEHRGLEPELGEAESFGGGWRVAGLDFSAGCFGFARARCRFRRARCGTLLGWGLPFGGHNLSSNATDSTTAPAVAVQRHHEPSRYHRLRRAWICVPFS